MSISLSWAPIDGALLTVGSRQSAINTLWRGIPEADRTPARRRLVIAVVDHIREHYERTGQLSPGADQPSREWTQGVGGVQCDTCERTTICQEFGVGQEEDGSTEWLCRPCYLGEEVPS